MRITSHFNKWFQSPPTKDKRICLISEEKTKDRSIFRAHIFTKNCGDTNYAPKCKPPHPTQAQSADALLQDAKNLTREGMHSESEAILSAIIKNDPDHAEALTWRGMNYRMLGRLGEAYSDFSRSLQIQPNQRLAILHRAALAFFTSGMEKALEQTNAFLSNNPDDQFALLCKGILDPSSEAIDALRHARAINKSNLAIMSTMCTRLRIITRATKSDMGSEARRTAEATLSIDPNNAAALCLVQSLKSSESAVITPGSLLGSALDMPIVVQDPDI